MPLVKGETSRIKQKHGLVEICSFLFPSYIINSKLCLKIMIFTTTYMNELSTKS